MFIFLPAYLIQLKSNKIEIQPRPSVIDFLKSTCNWFNFSLTIYNSALGKGWLHWAIVLIFGDISSIQFQFQSNSIWFSIRYHNRFAFIKNNYAKRLYWLFNWYLINSTDSHFSQSLSIRLICILKIITLNDCIDFLIDILLIEFSQSQLQ